MDEARSELINSLLMRHFPVVLFIMLYKVVLTFGLKVMLHGTSFSGTMLR